MTARTWLFDQLSQLTSHGVGDRVFAKKSMTSSVEDHPYIVFKFGNNTNRDLSEAVDASSQFVQIFVHDYADTETGDYLKIDEVIKEIKTKLENQGSAADGVITTLYLETSQDLDDLTLSTVFKYIRLQLVLVEN